MKIKVNVETTPEKVAQMLCETSTNDELFKLINIIVGNVDKYEFYKELSVYLNDILLYMDAEQNTMVED